jgi:hypothetical protein
VVRRAAGPAVATVEIGTGTDMASGMPVTTGLQGGAAAPALRFRRGLELEETRWPARQGGERSETERAQAAVDDRRSTAFAGGIAGGPSTSEVGSPQHSASDGRRLRDAVVGALRRSTRCRSRNANGSLLDSTAPSLHLKDRMGSVTSDTPGRALLDAYSRAVTGVAAPVSPSVVKIDVAAPPGLRGRRADQIPERAWAPGSSSHRTGTS